MEVEEHGLNQGVELVSGSLRLGHQFVERRTLVFEPSQDVKMKQPLFRLGDAIEGGGVDPYQFENGLLRYTGVRRDLPATQGASSLSLIKSSGLSILPPPKPLQGFEFESQEIRRISE
jgi:hypothetical protein